MENPNPVEETAVTDEATTTNDVLVTEDLIEDVSIDGMCGVY
jgi:mycofactocin precursor